jgi:hypothetical protein
MASYWRSPARQSPGYFGFKMFGNYDGHGSSFDGTALAVSSPDPDRLSTYAAVSADGRTLKVMLLNKDPEHAATVELDTGSFVASAGATYRYSGSAPTEIVRSELPTGASGADVTLAPYSINLIELRRG